MKLKKYLSFLLLGLACFMPMEISAQFNLGKAVKAADNATIEHVEQESDSDKIFEAVEQQAQFPGGQAAMMRWIASNLVYPEHAQENGIQGRVVVKFVVEKDGSISNPIIAKGVNTDLDREAIRVVKKMPKWQPGKNNGVAVRSSFTLPINFRLQ